MRVCRLVVFGLLIGVLGAGCSRKVAPVSSTVESKQTKVDSTVSRQSTVDSTSFVQTVTEKKLPEVTIDKQFRSSQLDSLLFALKNLPSNTPIIYQDKGMRAQLQILMDSIGNIHFKCSSLEKIYWEKDVKQKQYIEHLVNENQKLLREKSEANQETFVQLKTFWEKITENILPRVLIYIILGGLTVILLRTALKKIPFINKFIP